MNIQSVLVNGHYIHVTQQGNAYPAIVFEAGAGETSATWHPIIETLAQHARVCAYDRLGLGQSDHTRTPRTLPSMVEDLSQLVQILQIAPPYILVGHSLGGLIVYHYAQQHPDRVAGLVLLDAPHPRQIPYLSAVLTTYLDNPVVQELYTAITSSDPSTHPESLDFSASLTLVDHGPALPEVPLTVICRGRSIRTDIPELPLVVATNLDTAWQELQRDLGQRTTRGCFFVAEQSGHYIHEDAPNLIVTAIIDLIEVVRHA